MYRTDGYISRSFLGKSTVTVGFLIVVSVTFTAAAQGLICERLPESERETCEKAYERLIQDDGSASMPVVRGIGNAGNWEYTYELEPTEAGAQPLSCVLVSALTLPRQDKAEVALTALDTIHEWSVPALDAEAVAMPGRVQMITIKADQLGIFEGHSRFDGITTDIEVRLLEADDYDAWVRDTINACSN
jgi:heme/copper-type cytochrome/quinol oxidase subunit 2